jgi:hypothetical protein
LLLRRVVEDEPTAPLATGVHHRTLGSGRQLLEHLGAEAFDVRRREAAETAARKMDRSQKPAGLPVADRVLVHAKSPSRVANIE